MGNNGSLIKGYVLIHLWRKTALSFLIIIFKASKNNFIIIFIFRHSQVQSSPKECDVFAGYPNKVAEYLDLEVILYPHFRLLHGHEHKVCLWLLGPAIQTCNC